MGGIISFVVDNYIWFIVISVILVFALIGYIVDVTSKQNISKNTKETNNNVIEISEDKPINEIVSEKKPSEKEIKKEMYEEPVVIDEIPDNKENKL